jgi:cellulose synthase/poly-beta-1,6-N-acetylglucosamine synthase-like glycosyltransferase
MATMTNHHPALNQLRPRSERYSAAPLEVAILTYNEEKNLEACLRSLHGLAQAVFVVDSGSTDATVGIAERLGARVVYNPFEGHAKQWNWALGTLPWSFDWVLCLDADQRLTPELREEIREALSSPAADVDGFYMKRRQVFLGRWIRHGVERRARCAWELLAPGFSRAPRSSPNWLAWTASSSAVSLQVPVSARATPQRSSDSPTRLPTLRRSLLILKSTA